MIYVLLALVAIVYAEFSGYAVHALLHLTPEWFDKHRWAKPFRWLTRFHMGHHGLSYGVRMVQRPTSRFIDNPEREESTRLSFLNPEFVVPSIPFVGVLVLGLWLSGVTIWQGLFTMVVTGAWVAFAFNYMHDAFHETDHWMNRVPGLRWWYQTMRAAHDRHHTTMTRKGFLPYNLGIGLPFVDILFRTWKPAEEAACVLDDYTGQVLDTPFPEEVYDNFHELYRIEEPEYDRWVSEEVREKLQTYRPASDKDFTNPS